MSSRGRRSTLRKRDGDNCFFCGEPMQFNLHSNDMRASTLEHLLDLKFGGPDNVGNTVLAHKECNNKADSLKLTLVYKIKLMLSHHR